MSCVKLYIDGSVNHSTKRGFGAYLLLNHSASDNEKLTKHVQIKQFEQTSSTTLELETLLWAINEHINTFSKWTVFTDSQNIIQLQNRRKRLEEAEFYNKNNDELKNAALYKAFFKMIDTVDCEIIKLKGHKKKHEKDTDDMIFTLVDRASRKALRESY